MNIKLRLLVLILMLNIVVLSACGDNIDTARIADMTVNYRSNPMDVDLSEGVPVFSWRIDDDTAGQKQNAYRIVVSDGENCIWDSGKIESDISVAVAYGGDTLSTGALYSWRVYVWDKDDNIIESDEELFETGIDDEEWDEAKWIGLGSDSYDKTGKMITYPEEYTIVYYVDYNGENGDSGFIWGADEGRYGRYYQCEIIAGDGEDRIIISELYDGEYLNKNEMLLSNFDSINEGIHHVRLEVQGENIAVFIDDEYVMSTVMDNPPTIGSAGLWTSRGTFSAFYKNMTIVSSDGEVIWQGDFEPYYVEMIDGWYEASSGYLISSGWEMPAPMLRTEFYTDTEKEIETARIYASALGIYDIYINGTDICDEYMAPGQSQYSENVYYQIYDITEYVVSGDNAIGVIIGHGRYDRGNEDWGDNLAFIGKIVVSYTDGSSEAIVTDETWMTYDNGPIRNDDMYDGEYYDSNYELDGWSESGYALADWKLAYVYEEYDYLEKIPAQSEPVKVIDEISPVSVSNPIEGVYVYDFGQNFNGNCVIKIDSQYAGKGDVITLRYAEWEDDESGTIYTENLYTAKNTDYYVVSGRDDEEYTPIFVYRGFRYVQITGVNEMIPIESIKAYVISSDNDRTGYFTCSDDDINSLYNAIYWTQLSNYVDIPTDCPQRDERFGWAGDAQVFAQTACYNSNIYTFMDKYIDLLRFSQSDKGAYPEIAPSVNKSGEPVNGWSDAGVILVWEMYQQYGNLQIIEKNLDAMCRYVDLLVDTSEDYIRSNDDYSDHNAISNIDASIIDTAQCAYVSLLLSKMGAAVGNSEVADKYSYIYEQYRKAWQSVFINEDGSIGDWLQSEYTLGLAFDIYPDALAENGASCLNIAVSVSDFHLNTGYIATQFLLPVLCDYGYSETAYKILMQDTYPSWNKMLSYGNTTITEGWNTIYDTDDSGYGINGSLNHMALGSVGQWIYEYMLGIRRDEASPAFKHFYLEPVINTVLSYAQGSYVSMYGEIKSSWTIDGDEVIYNFTIPANTTATVSLGTEEYNGMELESGTYEYRVKYINENS